MNFDVITVGSAGFDIFASGPDLKPGLLTNKQAVNLVDRTSYELDHVVYETGGSGLNSAFTFARQGIKTACIAKTGRDHLANQLKIVAHHEGVGSELFINKAEHHTDMCFHMVTERASEVKLNYHNSLKSLRSRDLRFPGLKSRLLYLAELPVDYKLTKFLLLWAKANKAEVILHTEKLTGYRTRQVDFILSRVDRLIFPLKNIGNFGFAPGQVVECIRYLKSLGVERSLLYDELDYSYAFEDDTVYKAGVYRKTNPLDMTGAADVYAASYASALFQQKSVPEALTLASANATSVMSVMGARAGLLRKPALRTIKTKTSIL